MALAVSVYAEEPYYSVDGDTLYSGSVARIRALEVPVLQSPGYLLGSAGSDLVTSTMWGPEIRLTYLNESDTMGLSEGPWATVSEDTVFMSFGISLPWCESAPFLMSSYDGGETWSESWCITNDDTAVSAYHSFLHYYDNRLNVGGMSSRTQNDHYRNVYVKYSDDLGFVWSEPFFFFTRGQRYIGMQGGTSHKDTLLFAFYHGEDRDYNDIDSLKATHSFDNGETWSPLRNVSHHEHPFTAYYFHLRYCMGRVHLLYQDRSPTEGLTEIFYAFSDDWGESWSDAVIVSDDSSQHSQWSYLYASPEGILVASWYDYKYGSGESGFAGDILCRISTDNGETWGEEMQLTDHHEATASRSFINGNQIGMLWEDTRTGFFTPEFYFTESSDLGQTWTQELRLTDAPGLTGLPEMYFENNTVYLFWVDARDNPPFGLDIYFRRAEIIETLIGEGDTVQPNSMALSCYPNPFNSTTVLTLNGFEGGDAEIRIYGITGVLVKTLLTKEGRATWDATDNSGRKVSSGIYFAGVAIEKSVRTPRGAGTIKLLLLK